MLFQVSSGFVTLHHVVMLEQVRPG